MSKASVKKEIARFLASDEPEVLCVSGKWGVGKTYNWKNELFPAGDLQASDRKRVKLARYAYVSLFGINSLADLKYAIFENTVPLGADFDEPTIEAVAARTAGFAEVWSRKLATFGKQLPIVTKYIGDMGTAWFLLVRRQIVCFDDLERRGEGLSMRDVLGLASHLKEEKNCKVVLILNDEKLGNAKEAYDTLLEKVVDLRVRYAPSPEESIAVIASGAGEPDAWISADCLKLGISNIRIVKKVKNDFDRLAPTIQDFDEEVRRHIASALAILAYGVYMPNSEKFLAYVESGRRRPKVLAENEEPDPEEQEWDAILSVYGFSGLDDFDRILLDGVRDGYFDEDAVKAHAEDMQRRVLRNRKANSVSEVWDLYGGSFSDNAPDVVEKILLSFKPNIDVITPRELNSLVSLLKDLGEVENAKAMISHYVANRGAEKDFFDLSKDAFGAEVDDPDVRSAFEQKLSTFPDTRSVQDVLRYLSLRRGWSPDDIKLLATASVDDFKKAFLTEKGEDLSTIIRTALQFGRIINASEDMMHITNSAKEALTQIGEMSALNKRRVKTLYNVGAP